MVCRDLGILYCIEGSEMFWVGELDIGVDDVFVCDFLGL